MEVRDNRVVERAAVNAARSLFESCKYVFQENELGNDYGKDAYVDLTDNAKITGLCIALQIKGGLSYRRAEGYGIPLSAEHAEVWSQSSVPMAGIVYDPEDRQLRWCNITEYLQSAGKSLPSYIPVASSKILTADTLEKELKPSYSAFHVKRVVGPSLLQLTSLDALQQRRALIDCFVLGRRDGRVLILIRRLLHLFSGLTLRLAVTILTHATPHPDILWTPNNWIPEGACDELRPHLDWTLEEIELLMKSTDAEEWHRGGYGQDVYSLLCVDRNIEKKMSEVAIKAINGDDDLAFWAMYLAIYWARKEGPQLYDGFVRFDRRFESLELSAELKAILRDQGFVILFE